VLVEPERYDCELLVVLCEFGSELGLLEVPPVHKRDEMLRLFVDDELSLPPPKTRNIGMVDEFCI